MNKKADQWIDEHKDELIADMQECLRYPSLEGAPEEGMPFGKDVNDCLESTLAMARRLGFEAHNLDGYCGYVDYGEGDEMLGILAHLDVVPVGEGWLYPPFAAEIHDDKLYARGALDDKGPAIMSIYALKAVKEAGIPLKRKVRIILGCNEETGMKCVDYYIEKMGMPDMSFSPDANYPVVSSEKSGCGGRIVKKYASTVRLDAGQAPNIAPGTAKAFVPLDLQTVRSCVSGIEMPEKFSWTLTPAEGGTEIFMQGESCHASLPWEGANALQGLIYLMKNLPLAPEDKQSIDGLVKSFGMGYYGENLGLDFEDYSGRLTCNLGVMHWDENGFFITLDLRVPTSMDGDFIHKKLDEAAQAAGGTLERWYYGQGFSIPEDSELVQGLLNIFIERTGVTDAKPQRIGGGTYARHLKNAVSFGPEGYKCPSSVHVANEFITMEQIDLNTKLLADAIAALAGIPG